MGYHFVAFCSRRTRLVTVHPEPALCDWCHRKGKIFVSFRKIVSLYIHVPKILFSKNHDLQGAA